MIDPAYIGTEIPVRTIEVEKGQLRFFAKATGETNPIYFDEEAARAEGHPALPAPPTFCFSLNLLAPAPTDLAAKLGIDSANALHGEQSFEYSRPIYCGDAITLRSRIVDVYERKGGALEFLVIETTATNQRGELCVRMTQVGVVRRNVGER